MFFICTISIVYDWTVCVLYGLNVSVLVLSSLLYYILSFIVANSYVIVVVLYSIVYGSVSFVFEN